MFKSHNNEPKAEGRFSLMNHDYLGFGKLALWIG
jgi:hypothetical protein